MTIMKTRISTLRSLGAVIKGARLNLKLTQADLARRTAMDQATISSIECGKSSPKIDTLLLLFSSLNLELTVRSRESSNNVEDSDW